jgi:TolA-binding protein
MNCEETREFFTDLYDGTLSGAPLVTLSRHLDGCAACRQEWAAFRGSMHALRDLGDEEPSPGFALRVVERIERPSLWRRIVAALVYPLSVKVPIHAAALVVLGVGGLWLFQRSPEIRRAADVQAPVLSTRAAPAPLSPEPGRRFESAPSAGAPTAPPQPMTEPLRPSGPPKAIAPPEPAANVRAPEVPASPSAPMGAGKAPAEERAQDSVDRPMPARDDVARLTAPPPAGAARQTETQTAIPGALRSAPGRLESRERAEITAPSESAAPSKGGASAAAALARKSADALFSEAATDFVAQRYDTSIQALQAFLAQYPGDARVPDARFLLADAYRAQNRYADAGTEFEVFLRRYPGHRMTGAALYHQGEMRILAGDQAGCSILQDALSRYPDAREASSGRDMLAARCP